MRAILVATLILAACTGGGGGDAMDGGLTGSGSDGPAWSGGPDGHLFTYSGPLYELDARDGHVLRQVTTRGASNLVASPDTAYFGAFDDTGNGRTWQLAPGATATAQISDTSLAAIYGVVGGELIGEINEEKIARLDVASGVVTTFEYPSTLAQVFDCENGSLSDHTVYLACDAQTITSTGSTTSAGMLTFDLDTNTFGPYVVVTPTPGELSLASNVTNTPSGVIFTLYTGTAPSGATTGVRTVYKITGTSVSAPVTITGNSDDGDEQGAVGTTVFIALTSDDTVVPFDAATMTPGLPIEVMRPRHLRTGGGQVWIGTDQHDGRLAKLDPASRQVIYKSFPLIVSTEIDWLAFGGE
ncbi:MAG: hypothetical protein ABI467_06410 [Kofleriaceae bacterium]